MNERKDRRGNNWRRTGNPARRFLRDGQDCPSYNCDTYWFAGAYTRGAPRYSGLDSRRQSARRLPRQIGNHERIETDPANLILGAVLRE